MWKKLLALIWKNRETIVSVGTAVVEAKKKKGK